MSDTHDPIARFQAWLAEAEKSEPNDPTAMALASADGNGMPNVRMVLLKGVDERGFVFYTNFESAKGDEMQANPQAAMCFHWKTLRRQVRIQGMIEEVSGGEADDYFASRAKDSQIGAWASQQSRPLEDRFALEKAVARYAAKHALGTVPRPPYWSGYRLVHQRIEFWTDKPFRLHDREIFHRDGDSWWAEKLYP
ncbi:MAG: pyridoxamine 5'-phosphate oxidase [Rhodospirillaceae bacterium]|jgi:pyridoxamine 5'-phosphate oxidase|nr:pyridoxamine 5'-phosphate oxidase [Rhodospirillaceae bacterium]MBT4485951.1 pyridoxamine 5'-phosphate oxidase [Rhodospirillaceae bacterium]MBT5195588.1 pyridoxamine 5'-phosphate oxidase [Rhodospirillaceae bacterium]MBT5895828.1 pyridoxamine 5'-phosphate oxidase [Rhodospirillaceae bacterium]